jgi:hypothetical protein
MPSLDHADLSPSHIFELYKIQILQPHKIYILLINDIKQC